MQSTPQSVTFSHAVYPTVVPQAAVADLNAINPIAASPTTATLK
jgi:hypothetical protein